MSIATSVSGPKPVALLFINKDAKSSSLSRSDPQENATIGRHVQGWRRKDRYQRVLLSNRTQCQRASDLSRKHSFLVSSQAEAKSHDPSNPKASSKELAILERRKDFPRNQSIRDPDDCVGSPEPPLFRSIQLSDHAIDPFQAFHMKLDQQTHTLLQYYITVLHPSSWHLENRQQATAQQLFRPAAFDVIRGCLEREIDMYTLLASLAARMENLELIPVKNGTSTFMHRAVKAMQKYLADAPIYHNQLLLDLFHLFTAEAYRYNFDAAMVHLNALVLLVDRCGGILALDRHLMETFVVGDSFVAAEMLRPHAFTCIYDPGHAPKRFSLQASPETPHKPSCLGLGFLCVTQTDIVTDELCDAVVDIVECTNVLRSSAVELNSGMKKDMLRWLHLRNLSIRHRLLALELKDRRSFALRVALVMWILLVMSLLGPLRSVKLMVVKQRQILEAISAKELEDTVSSWVRHVDIHVWILVIGAMCAQGTAVEEWFVNELACCDANLASEEELKAVSERFFYLHSIQGPRLKILAEKLRQARSQLGCIDVEI